MARESEWRVDVLNERKTMFDFNVMVVGEPFNSNAPKTLFGCADGKVRIFNKHKEEDILETKGGAIQGILLHDMSRYGTVDLITADAEGNVVVFSNSQILFRTSVAYPVTCLCIDTDLRGYPSLVVGDMGGVLTSLQCHQSPLWKVRLPDDPFISVESSPSPSSSTICTNPSSIRCMISVNMSNENGMVSHYLLVAAGTPHLHFYSQGTRVLSLPTPSLVNTMCTGWFIDADQSLDANNTQIAIGCQNGFIYILQNYELKRYAHVDQPVTLLKPLQIPSLDLNPLVCAGYFNAIRVYHNKKMVIEKATQEWVQNISTGPNEEFHLGFRNNTACTYTLNYIKGT